MASRQRQAAMVRDERVPRPSAPSKRPRATIGQARAKLIDGDTAGARVVFDELQATQKTNAELSLVEALLLEAEGRSEEALACLGRVVDSTTGFTRIVALAHAHMARLAIVLGREAVAEAAGTATLALDPANIDGLRAVAFGQRRHAVADVRLANLRRLANATAAEESDIWSALEAFADFGHWDQVLDLVESREFQLDPWRMTPLRIRSLIELGWRGRALEEVCKAHASEYILALEAVELLIQWSALTLAALFIDECMSSDPLEVEARASVIEAATRRCDELSLRNAPIEFADAIQARDILAPGSEGIRFALARVFQVLTDGAGALLANNDPTGATRMLVAAARLAPADRALLKSLADAAFRADQTERYVDTLLRLWATHQDASALQAAIDGVPRLASWAMITRIMTIAASESGPLRLNIDLVSARFREQACRKVEEYLRAGELAAGLELAVDVSRQSSVADWRNGLLTRLLRATKRRLRSRRPGGEALIATVGALYLELAPSDVDVCRMLGRVRVRQRSLSDARELFLRIVTINPHVASDWMALALAQHELGEFDARDLSIARALVIAPDVELPSLLVSARNRAGPA